MEALPVRPHRFALLTLAVTFAVLISSCTSLTPPNDAENTEGCDGCKDRAKLCKDPTMHALRADLDHLQEHIDCYGSIVAKQPDVWGRAGASKLGVC